MAEACPICGWDGGPYMEVKEVASLFQCSKSTVYRLIKEAPPGGIPISALYRNNPHRRLLVAHKDLDAYVRRNTTGAA